MGGANLGSGWVRVGPVILVTADFDDEVADL